MSAAPSSPFDRLPPDVVCEIFHALADESGAAGFIPFTHVCKALRNIGLSMAQLWADNIDTAPRQAWETFLARSKTAPLRIELNGSMARPQIVKYKPVLGRAHTITLLSFGKGDSAKALEEILAALREVRLPYLRLLRCLLFDGEGVRSSSSAIAAPALREYAGHCLPLDAPNLRAIFLVFPTAMANLLRFLRFAPAIDTLVATHVRCGPEQSLGPEELIHLPNMRSLWLAGDVGCCQKFCNTAVFQLPETAYHWPNPFHIGFCGDVRVDEAIADLRCFGRQPAPLPSTMTIVTRFGFVDSYVLVGDDWDPAHESRPRACCVVSGSEHDGGAFERSDRTVRVLLACATVYGSGTTKICIPGSTTPPDHSTEGRGFGLSHADLHHAALALLYNVTEINVGPSSRNLFKFLQTDKSLLPKLVTIIADVRKFNALPHEDAALIQALDEVAPFLEGHAEMPWWLSLVDLLKDRQILRLVLRGRLCHVAIVEAAHGRETKCHFKRIPLDNVSDLAEHVVDEREPCMRL